MVAGVLMLLAVVIAGVSGCMEKETLEEQMVSYMEEKYGDSFSYVRPWGSSLGQKHICRVLQSDRYPGQDVLVSCSGEDGKMVFHDSYPALEFQPLAAEKMQEACEETWPGLQVRTEQVPALRVLTDELGEDPALEDYTAWQYNGDYYNIFVDIPADEEKGKEDAERLRQTLESRNMAARMYLYYGKSTEDYENMIALQMDGNFVYIREKWEEE